MARLTFAALLVLAASVQGTFTIPKGTPDGVYGVSYDADGNANHFSKRDGTNFTTAKPGLEPSDIQNKHSFSKRADGPKCVENGAVLARNDITQAQYALADACDASGDEFIPDHGNRYSKFGAAVVSVCNYGVKSQHCYSSELNSDLSEVQDLCGNVAGKRFVVSCHRSEVTNYQQVTTAVTPLGRRRTALRMPTMAFARGMQKGKAYQSR